MKQLTFIEGGWPEGFKPDFESFLFNDERHRLLQSPAGWHSYSLIREDKKRVLASLHFCLENDLASSPHKAPFGSVEISKHLQPLELFDFLKEAERYLKKSGVRKVRIKNPPMAYNPASASLMEVMLLNLGYQVHLAEISTTLVVKEKNYSENLEGWELRKLRQGKKAMLAFREVKYDSLQEVYQFIRFCREERVQSLSMSLAEIEQTSKALPKTFLLFGVYHGEELVAASISIRINTRILYNFYSGHPRKWDRLSPVVSLMQGMYVWCLHQKVELIDLGTSAFEGQPNFSLLDFKRRLGGVPSPKLTFEKDLT